jgi:hypothetical protein
LVEFVSVGELKAVAGSVGCGLARRTANAGVKSPALDISTAAPAVSVNMGTSDNNITAVSSMDSARLCRVRWFVMVVFLLMDTILCFEGFPLSLI